MSKRKRFQYNREGEPELDLSSLIDICFLVLIYFLVSMTVVPREQDLALALPGSPDGLAIQQPIRPMILKIDAAGIVFSGDSVSEQVLDEDSDSRELPLLSSLLELYYAAALSAGDEPAVFLRIDQETNQQRVIDVLNALGKVGITVVHFEDLIEL